MKRMTFLFNALAIFFAIATALLQWYGVEYSFYWTTWWWDIFAHLGGGLTIGFWLAAVSSRYRLPPAWARIVIIGGVLLVAIAWELWELVEGVAGGPGGYWIDTTKDLFDGVLGATIAWIIYKRLLW
jgi:hypothetical protein